MASIRCKACGCTYDYNKEGMCPKCGAYMVLKRGKGTSVYKKCSNAECETNQRKKKDAADGEE